MSDLLLTEGGETLLSEDSEELITEAIFVSTLDPAYPVQTATIELCDLNFGKLHELETGTLTAVTRRNQLGAGRVEGHLDEVPPDVLLQVNAVVVSDERRIMWAGYRMPNSDESAQGGTMREIGGDVGRRFSIEFVDCWHWLTSRLVFPNPATEYPWAVTADVRSGQGSTVIKAFIEANAGVSALPGRAIPGLTVYGSPVGSLGEWSGRLQRLSELVRRIASEAEVVVHPTLISAADRTPVVNIREAVDRTASVVVADISDLAEAEQRDVPPRSTWMLAAGSGEGASRMFRSAGGGSGVSRIEKLVEATNATTSNELFQIANARRREDGFAFYVSGRTNELAAEQYRYLVDYELGDLVSVQVQGIRFSVPITAIELSMTKDRVLETPILGEYSPNRLEGIRKDILNLAERFEDNIA